MKIDTRAARTADVPQIADANRWLAAKSEGLRLYGEKNNTRAQATYAALGMHGETCLVMESMF